MLRVIIIYYLLQERYPCPPHLSLQMETTSSRSQEAVGLIAQHIVTTSYTHTHTQANITKLLYAVGKLPNIL